MAFSVKDLDHVKNNVWRTGEYHNAPCNILFASAVNARKIESLEHVEALISRIRIAGKHDQAPACAFSVTSRESGWEHVMRHIKSKPQHFQTITTGSRHGLYKVMWVVFRTNGRKF